MFIPRLGHMRCVSADPHIRIDPARYCRTSTLKLRTAKAPGLEVPFGLSARADSAERPQHEQGDRGEQQIVPGPAYARQKAWLFL